MNETEIVVEVIDLTSLREVVAALSAEERLEIVTWWSHVEDGVGRGASGWFKHFVTQRTGEIRGAALVELGPVGMMSPNEVGGLDSLCRWQAQSTRQSRAVSRYFSELSLVFSERAVRPGERLPFVGADAGLTATSAPTATAREGCAANGPPGDQSSPDPKEGQ